MADKSLNVGSRAWFGYRMVVIGSSSGSVSDTTGVVGMGVVGPVVVEDGPSRGPSNPG